MAGRARGREGPTVPRHHRDGIVLALTVVALVALLLVVRHALQPDDRSEAVATGASSVAFVSPR